jgi:hypothetical protein
VSTIIEAKMQMQMEGLGYSNGANKRDMQRYGQDKQGGIYIHK